MRILLHSNGPNTPTGYGVQTALLARRLRDAGHEVAISVYWGHQTGLGNWEGIPLLPCSGESYGNDILHEHAIRWFDGDPLGGWIIPIMDVFGLSNPLLRDFNVAAWTPIDHDPVPQAILDFFQRSDATAIAMSKWGQDLLAKQGVDSFYVPLSVDTSVFKPIPDAKRVCGLPDDRFVVAMNGMNKGWAMHRKGYPEAFLAFGQFARNHPDALLYIHAEQWGMYAQGINLIELAAKCGIGENQIKFVDQYAYRCGFVPQEQLAAVYSAADVLLAPSRGEGFCIPLIEAQACGTPVIVTDFSAQSELVGAGWKLPAQPDWEAAQGAWMAKADIPAIMQALEEAYEERGSQVNRDCAIAKAREYDADLVFDTLWKPVLGQMAGGRTPDAVKPPIPDVDGVAVLVPVLDRVQNVAPLVESFVNAGDPATLYFVCNPAEADLYADAVAATGADHVEVLVSGRGSTFAQKVNSGYQQTTEPWLFICGDDVRFHPGWVAAARKLSDRYDVIGTNDNPDPKRGNAKVQSGSHADHWFIRRAYADEDGGSLDGLICHEGYAHFYSDVEVIELAKARGVFTPCLDSMVEHVHPDLNPDVPVDDTYRLGWSQREADEKEWQSRQPFVDMQKVGLGKVRVA